MAHNALYGTDLATAELIQQLVLGSLWERDLWELLTLGMLSSTRTVLDDNTQPVPV